MAMKRKVDSAETLERYIKEFIALCSATDTFPSDFELQKYIGCSAATLKRYRQGKEPYQDYSRAFEPLKNYAESILIEKGMNARNPAFQVFLLKQDKFGGYTDQQQIKQDVKINFSGGENSFK